MKPTRFLAQPPHHLRQAHRLRRPRRQPLLRHLAQHLRRVQHLAQHLHLAQRQVQHLPRHLLQHLPRHLLQHLPRHLLQHLLQHLRLLRHLPRHLLRVLRQTAHGIAPTACKPPAAIAVRSLALTVYRDRTQLSPANTQRWQPAMRRWWLGIAAAFTRRTLGVILGLLVACPYAGRHLRLAQRHLHRPPLPSAITVLYASHQTQAGFTLMWIFAVEISRAPRGLLGHKGNNLGPGRAYGIGA